MLQSSCKTRPCCSWRGAFRRCCSSEAVVSATAEWRVGGITKAVSSSGTAAVAAVAARTAVEEGVRCPDGGRDEARNSASAVHGREAATATEQESVPSCSMATASAQLSKVNEGASSVSELAPPAGCGGVPAKRLRGVAGAENSFCMPCHDCRYAAYSGFAGENITS